MQIGTRMVQGAIAWQKSKNANGRILWLDIASTNGQNGIRIPSPAGIIWLKTKYTRGKYTEAIKINNHLRGQVSSILADLSVF